MKPSKTSRFFRSVRTGIASVGKSIAKAAKTVAAKVRPARKVRARKSTARAGEREVFASQPPRTTPRPRVIKAEQVRQAQKPRASRVIKAKHVPASARRSRASTADRS